MPETDSIPAIWQFRNVQRILQTLAFPEGPFNPDAPWEHTYNIHFLNYRPKGGKGNAKAPAKGKGKGKGKGPAASGIKPDGIVKIASTPKGDGIELLVESSALMTGDMTTYKIRCLKDALSTPVSWDLSFTNETPQGKELASFSKSGSVEGGILMKDGVAAKRVGKLTTYTSDWSLFDAAQRFGRADFAKPLTCDMLEYLDVIRPRQVIESRGATRVEGAKRPADAREYVQYGEAVLPTHYYLDANDRLFMVLGSRRLFVLVDEKV